MLKKIPHYGPVLIDHIGLPRYWAGSVLAGIELMHMIRKGQFAIDGTDAMSFADQFAVLAGIVRPV